MKKAFAAASLISLALASTGCSKTIEFGSEEAPFDTTDISYTQDTRTGMCFAYMGSGAVTLPFGDVFAFLGLAKVECTPEVLELSGHN